MTSCPTTIQLAPQYRYLQVDAGPAIVDQESREVTFAFSSEAPVKRLNWDVWEYVYEVLSHDAAHANLDRCNQGAAPLLWNHDINQHRGIITKAWIEDRRAYCTARFGNGAEAAQLMNDVNDGIVRNVSFMYRIHELLLTEVRENDLNTYTAQNWEVFEISFCSIPADPSVGIGRANPHGENPVSIVVPAHYRSMPVKTESNDELELLKRQLAEKDAAIATLQRQQTMTARLATLKEKAMELVGERKLTTANFEDLFSAAALKRYAEGDGSELNSLDFYLKQTDKFSVTSPAFSPEVLASSPVPPPPSERTTEEGTPKADEFLAHFTPRRPY